MLRDHEIVTPIIFIGDETEMHETRLTVNIYYYNINDNNNYT